jgi:hypothetical protein
VFEGKRESIATSMRPVAALDLASFAAVNHRRLSLSWFHLLRIFPFFLVSSWTTSPPLSFGLLNTNGISNNIINDNNNNGQPKQPYQILPGDNTIGYPQLNTDDDHYLRTAAGKGTIDGGKPNNRTNSYEGGPPRPLSEEDQKFLERVQSSINTVQNWETDVQLLKECRTVIPWDDLRNATGPYSNRKDDRLLQGNALFLQRLCRWFPKFMSWVNTPPCQVCGHKECEMKTVRSPETEEEKEGEAKRVEGE